ncbi:hypothetical protein JCM17960_17720 [Magnetospira thiophila]
MSETAPPFSPVLLAGFVLRPLPPRLLQPLLDLSMTLLRRRHPDVFERLSGMAVPLVLIDPIDLPLRFLLHADPQAPRLTALGDGSEVPEGVTATIGGPLLVLIDLLEGRIDGDALFFTRQLHFGGDTEAVVALRNALDGAEIDLVADVLSVLGPAARPARHALSLGQRLMRRFARDLDLLRSAALAPAERRADTQAADLRRLELKVADLDKAARRTRRSAP